MTDFNDDYETTGRYDLDNEEDVEAARRYLEERGLGSSATTDEALDELLDRKMVALPMAHTLMWAMAEEARDRLDDEEAEALVSVVGGVLSAFTTGLAYGLHMAPVFVKSRSVTGLEASTNAVVTLTMEELRPMLAPMVISTLRDFDTLVEAGVESITSPAHRDMVGPLVAMMFDAMEASVNELAKEAFPETDAPQLLCYVGEGYRRAMGDGLYPSDSDRNHTHDDPDSDSHKGSDSVSGSVDDSAADDKTGHSSYEEKLAEAMRKAGVERDH